MPPVFLTARDTFAYEHQAREIKWSGYNLTRLLRRTGERPERIAEMRATLGALGMGGYNRWPNCDGVFDHGQMWSRHGEPWAIVGHPYGIDAAETELLRLINRFGTLRALVNDRESYYGFGTDHVRIELVESRRPFAKPPSTPKTRAAARAARRAFAVEMEI